jgi:hypothetical protein
VEQEEEDEDGDGGDDDDEVRAQSYNTMMDSTNYIRDSATK